MSSQIHTSRLSSWRLFYRHNLSSAPVWQQTEILPTAADANAGALCNYKMHVILLLLLFVLELWLKGAVSNDIRHKDPPRPQPACRLKYRSGCDPRGSLAAEEKVGRWWGMRVICQVWGLASAREFYQPTCLSSPGLCFQPRFWWKAETAAPPLAAGNHLPMRHEPLTNMRCGRVPVWMRSSVRAALAAASPRLLLVGCWLLPKQPPATGRQHGGKTAGRGGSALKCT